MSGGQRQERMSNVAVAPSTEAFSEDALASLDAAADHQQAAAAKILAGATPSDFGS